MQKTLVLCAAALVAQAGAGSLAHAASLGSFDTLTGAAPVVVGHRGAPAYLPENTIGGNELAADMGSDWIETDVMMTSDGVLIAMHDSTLTRTTDIEEKFAARNGGYSVSDFTYAEIQTLTANPDAVSYPGFTPSDADAFRVPSFADMLDALNDYNAVNGTSVGILTEAKYGYNPDTNRAVVETLAEKGFTSSETSVIQSFDFGNVFDFMLLQDDLGTDMGLAQLGGVAWNGYEWTVSSLISLDVLSQYVDTVAVYAGGLTEGFIDAAHGYGLSVFAWTYRPSDLTAAFDQMSTHIEWGLDGLITDNPDLANQVIDSFTAAPAFATAGVLPSAAVSAVPVPAALPLMGAALGGLALLRRRRTVRA